MPYGTDVDKQRGETSGYLQEHAYKRSMTKLNFRKCESLTSIKEDTCSMLPTLVKLFLYVLYIITRKLKSIGMTKGLQYCGFDDSQIAK